MTETAALIQTKLKAFRIIHLAMVMGSVIWFPISKVAVKAAGATAMHGWIQYRAMS